jgi:hypothetical protein
MNTLHASPALSRRRLLAGAAALAALPTEALSQAPSPIAVEVWKSPTCGCCKDWIKHIEAQGQFKAAVREVGNTQARAKLGIPLKLGSCHTAKVGPYAIEGHVPAREMLRLLKERPDAIGLTVPGMPIGSPGMDGPEYGGQRDAYEVLLVLRDGSTRPYAKYA